MNHCAGLAEVRVVAVAVGVVGEFAGGEVHEQDGRRGLTDALEVRLGERVEIDVRGLRLR